MPSGRTLAVQMSEKPATKGRRLFKLASMTAQVAGGYAKNRIKSVFQSDEASAADRAEMYEKSGEVIAKTLGELKGAVMKVGQMASVAADVLPKEVQDALTSLQREAPPMPYDVIADQIESEFSAAPETLFRSFERVPFASASIGQVHRAVTDDGREVVVKVQYPGVDGAVDSDLAHLKLALRASGLVRVPKKSLDAVFTELKARLHEELDYTNEADNVRFFFEHYKGREGVVVPEVVGERSSGRVLTLTYEPGDHLDEARSYPRDVRDQIADNLFDIVAEQAFDLQVIHADPNPANFAFRPDGSIVLYDFGCVKTLDPKIVEAYLFLVKAGLEERYEDVEQGMIGVGARNLDGTPVPPKYYKVWRDVFAKPFLGTTFDFGEAQLQREAMKHVPAFMAKYMTSFQPPPELVFLDRVVVGHYGTLRRLGASANFRPKLEPFMDRAPPSLS
jgi:predicted unusual protein kinase regulating ubiquinone biosynthesis (AarF/ABC1/UbiB family)